MNKLLQKVAKIFLGLSMAAGVGVAVGSNVKKSSPVEAASPASITISDLGWGSSSSNAKGESNKVAIDDNVAFYFSGGSDVGKYYTTSPAGARMYYSGSDSITVKATTTGVKLTSITFKWALKNSGCLHSSKTTGVTSVKYPSNTAVALSSVDSVTAYVANTGSATNGQVAIQQISVSYTVPTTYTVTYYANNATSGSVPIDSTKYTSGSTVTVKTNSGNLQRTGYTFGGWNTNSSGTGTNYTAGTGTFSISGNTDLFAKWNIISYSVSASISYGSFSGSNTVNYGTAYNATISPSENHTLPTTLDSVTIGGVATSNYSYNSSTGAFSIAASYVVGNIAISAECPSAGATEYIFSYDLSHCSIEAAPESMYSDQIKELVIVPDDHFKLPTESANKVSVTGAVDWHYDEDDGTITIDGAEDDLTVTVECVAKETYDITLSLTNVTKSSGPSGEDAVEEGEEVTIVFAASANYGLPSSISVEMGGDELTADDDYIWTQNTGTLYLLELTDDLTVTISGVARDLTNGNLTLGSKKTSYTLGDDFELPSTITANFNSAPLTVDVKNDVEISGPYQNGVVTGSGTITLTYTYEPTGSTQSASYAITAPAITPSAGGIAKVTNVSDLTVGSTVYLVCEGRSKQLSGISTTSTKYGLGDDYTTTPVDTYPLTVCAGYSSGTIAFKNSSNSYLYWVSGNSLNVNSTLSNDTSWTVTISSGNATILNAADNSRQIMWNYSSPRFACYSGQTPTYDTAQGYNMVQLYKNYPAVVKTLKWITAELKSGNYYKGNSVTASDFTVTAHYDDGTSETVTSNISVTNGTLNNIGTNDVTLTYGGKSCVVQVTASYAPVTGVALSPSSASIGLNESYWLSDIEVTVNPSITSQEVAWELYNAGGLVENTDYTFDGDEYHSINEGTVVFRCKSVLDNTKYADFTLTIAGDPIADFAKSSTSGYVGKNETLSFTYGNFDSEDIVIASGNTSYVTIGTISASEGSGTVVIYFVGAGSTSVTIGDGSSTLDTITVTANADSVTSVTWSATNLDVWSGDTLNTSGWNVQYEMASGDSGSAPSYTIKLVGQTTETITSGYSFKGSDNGKTIHVEYGGVSSSSINVAVTQRINNVFADNMTTSTATWAAASDDDIRTNTTGSLSTDVVGISWSFERTNEYIGWVGGSSNWYQIGKSGGVDSITLSGTFTGTVIEVDVECYSYNGAHDLTITVGGEAFYSSATTPTSIDWVEAKGSGTGEVVISFDNGERAMYLRSIIVKTLVPDGTTTQIANSSSHKAAQRAAVAFAQAFNAAMDETENCTTGLDAAWTTCSNAYNSFKTAAAALGSTEEAYAKNLIKYATAQYSDDSAEACIERMMKTYEICVQKHGKTAFMSDLVTLSAPQVSPLVNIIGENTNTVAIIVIISMVSVTAIGGYFFLRKRKENN